ncbi:MAG TPA: PAS domain S-box protein [Blastocatellia bacterium]|nr:PAS domain S-box protein [Blastocatellia bacterium]
MKLSIKQLNNLGVGLVLLILTVIMVAAAGVLGGVVTLLLIAVAGLVLNRDLTERRKAEAALRESEKRYRGLFENSPLGMYRVSPQGRVLMANPAFERMMGVSDERLLPRSVESIRTRRNGTKIIVSENTTAVRDQDGKVVYYEVTVEDITNRKEAEITLRDSEARFRDLFDEAPVGYHEIDAEGRIIRINHTELEMLGYTAQDVVGRPIWEFSPDQEATRQEIATKLSGEAPLHTTEGTIWHKDGAAIKVLVQERLVRAPNERITGLRVILQDITERKKMEAELQQARDAALESARLKSEFLNNMGHDVRTPINAVIGMAGLLLDTPLTGEQQEYADTIRSSADSLLSIVNNILDYSKLEKDEFEFDVVDFNLRTVVEETIEFFAEQSEKKGIRLASIIYSDVPPVLRADRARLQQVLYNLIDNALKFTERGEIIIRVSKESVQVAPTPNPIGDVLDGSFELNGSGEPGVRELIRFAITDSGIGISEETQRRLFQAFTQADGSSTRRHNGTGLGLAISQEIVVRMGGQIGLESQPGKGSTFWFTIWPEKWLQDVPAESDLRAIRVLIAADGAEERKNLMKQAISWEMSPEEAESGKQVLDRLRGAAQWGELHDLLIVEARPNGIDLGELLNGIKSDSSLASVRVVALFTPNFQGQARLGGDPAISASLTKPVLPSRLYDCLVNVVKNGRIAELNPSANSRPVTRHLVQPVTVGRLLIVEDNIANQKVTLRQIEKLGYRADTVANGREALEAMERYPYALVLMDCQMPEMDGFTAATEIRRREGEQQHTPVIALTANAVRGEREKCLAAGMDDYLSKPVNIEELADTLAQWLSIGQSHSAPEAADDDDVLDPQLIQPGVDAGDDNNTRILM